MIKTNDPVVSLLYELMRDHVTPTRVTNIVETDSQHTAWQLTDDDLAAKALSLTQTLRARDKDLI